MSKKNENEVDWFGEDFQPPQEYKGVKKSLRRERIEVCNSCEKLTKMKTCGVCGCFMPFKVYFKIFNCPLNKWPSKYS